MAPVKDRPAGGGERDWVVRGLLLFVVALLASGGSAGAQADPRPGLLPDAATIGGGWVLVAKEPSGDLDASFRDGAFGVYAGPDGARTVVSIYAVATGMTAIRQSWEIANGVFDGYRGEIDYRFDASIERDLTAAAAPDGCADVRRIEGAEKYGYGHIPMGMTLCAADPDLIVLAFVSGPVGDRTGHEASDAVVEAVLAGRGGATPVAAP